MQQINKIRESSTKRFCRCGLFLVLVMQFFPTLAFGIELNIRDYFSSQVERSDNLLNHANSKVDQKMHKTTGLIEGFAKNGFSLLEKKTKLSEENVWYMVTKKSCLQKTGILIGAANGTTDIVMGTAALTVKLTTLPARTITFAYNVKEEPQKYKRKVITGAETMGAVLLNPLPLLEVLYESGKSTVLQAQKDPLEWGKLQGEVGVFAGSLLFGGGQTKCFGFINKMKSATLADTLTKLPALHIPQLSFGIADAIPFGTTTSTSTYKARVCCSTRRIYKTKIDSSYPFCLDEIKKSDSIIKGASAELSWIKGFDTADEIRDTLIQWGESAFAKWRSSLSKTEQAAINAYTKTSVGFNPALRKPFTIYKGKDFYNYNLVASSIQKSVLPEMLLFRGTNKKFLGELANLPAHKLVGKSINTKGFLSASLFPLEYYYDGVQMILKVPKGVNGACLGSLSNYNREAEVLLSHGQQMRIVETTSLAEILEDPDGLLIVAELLPKLNP